MSIKKSSEKTNFWQDYRACVLEQGVPEAKAVWYVTWAESFARSQKGLPLKERTAEHVTAFLSNLNQQANVKEWQIEQAREALRVLYAEFFKFSWAGERTEKVADINEAEGDPFRDSSTSKEVDVRHGDVIKRLRTEIRVRHYSIRTEQAYEDWVRRFVTFHKLKSPRELGPDAVKEYLEYLAETRKVAASTQNQALNALVFLYEQVMKEPLGTIGDFTRAKRPKRLPVVLTREEMNLMLDSMSGIYELMAGLMYGGGLRLMDAVRLRVKDLDFAQSQIVVRDGKGKKDRITILNELRSFTRKT